MYKTIEILKCKECGATPVIEQEMTLKAEKGRTDYRIICPRCGKQTTSFYAHVENALDGWNGMNRPNKKKPTYHCGQCGEEIPFGFAVCPKCGTEVVW